MGQGALGKNNSGSKNTATGTLALYSNYSGDFNTATGTSALLSNSFGSRNTANGKSALELNVTGENNTANGIESLFNNNAGSRNTASGNGSLYLNYSGSDNVSIGDSSGYNSLGNGNIFLGKMAGFNETGNDKLYIGRDSTIIYGDISTGQVLLGKKNPTNYVFKGTRTLNVIHGIIADSIWVGFVNTWADYVFEKDYKMLSLKELENYIYTNKHLPNIPPAKEVAADGIELGTMNAKLLEKIEELTLYILQQEKNYQLLKAEVEKLKQ
jgi:hypothetical protein